MSWLQEFKTFAMRGNVVDMAVGIIIGAAFTKIVNSLVSDIIMPPLGFFLGGLDMSDYRIILKEATMSEPAVDFNYGLFFNSVIEFMIVAFAVFLLIKAINELRLTKKEQTAKEKDCPQCLMQIPIKAKRCGHCGQSLVSNG